MINAPHTTPCECFPINPAWKAEIHPGMPGAMRLAIEMIQVRETAKAVLFRDPAGRDHWFPKSAVNASRAYKYVKPVYTVIMPAWLARKVWADDLAAAGGARAASVAAADKSASGVANQ